MNAFGQPRYGITKVLNNTGFDEAIEQVTARLGENGFGILTSIDVQNTLQQKIGTTIQGPMIPTYNLEETEYAKHRQVC